jgi:hypothetical protein
MVIDGTDPVAAAKPDGRLIKPLVRGSRFNAILGRSDSVPFAALAKCEGVSPSYFTRVVRTSYLARISPKRSSMGVSRAISRILLISPGLFSTQCDDVSP